MALQLYVSDAIFFNFHTLHISQVVLVCFFCIVIMADFVLTGHGFIYKKLEDWASKEILFEDCASTFISFFLLFGIFPFFSYWVLGSQLLLGVGVGHCHPSLLSVVSVLDTNLSRTVFSQSLTETHFMCP